MTQTFGRENVDNIGVHAWKLTEGIINFGPTRGVINFCLTVGVRGGGGGITDCDESSSCVALSACVRQSHESRFLLLSTVSSVPPAGVISVLIVLGAETH